MQSFSLTEQIYYRNNSCESLNVFGCIILRYPCKPWTFCLPNLELCFCKKGMYQKLKYLNSNHVALFSKRGHGECLES